MNKGILVSLVICCLLASSCGSQSKPHISETMSKTVDARAGQNYVQYAVYNPVLSVEASIEAEDVEYATGIFLLLNATEEKLKRLSDIEFASLYYNQLGQVIIEIKGR